MKLENILSAKAPGMFSITPSHTVRQAIDLLVEHNIGSLLVVNEDALAGIITERDILRLCSARIADVDTLTVAEVMTTDLIVGQPDDDVEYTMSVMTDRHIRHLPVLGEDGTVAGFLSIGDLVKETISEQTFIIGQLEHYISH